LSADAPHGTGEPTGAPGGPGEPSEEELRAAYEAELSRITAVDMMAQAAVSLLNIGARRLGPPVGASGEGGHPEASGADLEQAGDAIDGARALLGILDRRIPQELGGLRDALSQLQMAYAREVQGRAARAAGERGDAPAPPPGAAPAAAAPPEPGAGEKDKDGPGPAEASGRLWVPGR
jgi:hypothetical protein